MVVVDMVVVIEAAAALIRQGLAIEAAAALTRRSLRDLFAQDGGDSLLCLEQAVHVCRGFDHHILHGLDVHRTILARRHGLMGN